ncbi:unnamed protein product [Adineta ricciae]|uniref:SOCS box domain-containing protein n=1 Tax=Adineta ricciae TaxID=249248 RepID=A0A814JUS6_ADIRI|nr:unnamed protein product [Adineta ricciae]
MANDTMKADLSRLRTYIQHGKIKKINGLLNNQAKRINYCLEQQFDACAYATKFKQEKILRQVHDYGFPIDGYPNTDSITALIIAIRRSDLAFIQILIELGCDVNCSVRSYTIIPLLEAYQICKDKQDNLSLFETRKDIFQYLLQSGASPNVYNIHHMRLVHLTVIDGEFDFLQRLLNHGAHANVITATHRKNLLHLICDRTVDHPTEHLLELMQQIIRLGCDVNYRDDCFETPLMCTLHRGGNITLAHELIVEGTRLDWKNNFGNTYLTRAVHYALYDHARMALYAGAACRPLQCAFPYINRKYQHDQSTHETNLMDAIIDYEKFMSEMERYLVKPRQLKDIARLAIRKTLPCPLSKSIATLENYLPCSLIQYLLLKEMKTVLNLLF